MFKHNSSIYVEPYEFAATSLSMCYLCVFCILSNEFGLEIPSIKKEMHRLDNTSTKGITVVCDMRNEWACFAVHNIVIRAFVLVAR